MRRQSEFDHFWEGGDRVDGAEDQDGAKDFQYREQRGQAEFTISHTATIKRPIQNQDDDQDNDGSALDKADDLIAFEQDDYRPMKRQQREDFQIIEKRAHLMSFGDESAAEFGRGYHESPIVKADKSAYQQQSQLAKK